MGMVLGLMRVSSQELEQFLEDSIKLEDKFFSDESYTADWFLDLDKAWDAVQYLLSKKSALHLESPLSVTERALISLVPVDEEQDLGYGPAHYLTSEEVKETSKALNNISLTVWKNRYNGHDMVLKEIYPGGWSDPELEDYVIENLVRVIEFYREAASKNESIVSVMN